MGFRPTTRSLKTHRAAGLLLFAVLFALFGCFSGSPEENLPAEGQETEVGSIEPEPAGETGVPRFEAGDCLDDYSEFDIEYECGTFVAWENRDLASGALVRLPVIILYSKAEAFAPDPLVYLSGGPGDSGTEVESWLGLPFLGERDMILFDQRGTGGAEPTLNCPEMDTDPTTDAMADCLNRLLSEGIDLEMYNSAASAADVAELMSVLGYDSYNLIGISYGTRLALTVMRDHPEGLRAVILDSVYPPQVDGYAEDPINVWNALTRLFDACYEDPTCDGAYPDLENVFLETITILNDTPVQSDSGDIYGIDFVTYIFQALYDAAQIPYLPLVIYDTYDGYTDSLLDLIDGNIPYSRLAQTDDVDTDSEGGYSSVQCREEAPFTSLAAVEALSQSIPEPARTVLVDSVRQGLDECTFWASGTASAIENQPVASGIPTLLLSGDFDPVTPASWGQSAADYLSNSFFFIFPGVGHSVVDSTICAQDIALAFLRDPGAEPDSSCIAEMPAIEFYTP